MLKCHRKKFENRQLYAFSRSVLATRRISERSSARSSTTCPLKECIMSEYRSCNTMIINAHSSGNSVEFVKRDYRCAVTVIYDRRSTRDDDGILCGPWHRLMIVPSPYNPRPLELPFNGRRHIYGHSFFIVNRAVKRNLKVFIRITEYKWYKRLNS